MHCESPLWLHWFVQDVALRGSRARSGDNVRDLRVLAHALVLRSGVVRRRSVDFRGDVNLQCIEHLGVALGPRRFDLTVAAAAATPRWLTLTPKPRATAAQWPSATRTYRVWPLGPVLRGILSKLVVERVVEGH